MDFAKACERMKNYISRYDTEDEKIKLKIIHTYGVVSCAEYITARSGCSEADTELARHIALLHDIGRFEQLRLYNSFDDSIVSHAKLSLDILFGERGIIRDFIPESCHDSVIFTAIANHGRYLIDDIPEPGALLHAKLIRDADKLDNFSVKYESDLETMMEVSAEELGAEPITAAIFHAFQQEKPIENSERKTHMDMWVSYLGYLFDLNFPASYRYLKEHRFVKKLVERVPYSNPETSLKMELIRKTAEAYIEKKLS